jgi:uncharacterized surface protein with fasciclin (FAS1) repeats
MMAAACNNSSSTSDAEKAKAKSDSMAMAMKKDSTDKAMAMQKDTMGKMVGGAMMVKSKDIVDNAMGSADHKTLVAAVKQAGLVDALKGPGPLTVFAPTDEAFGKVDKKALDGLMTDAQKPALQSILKYHVVSGSYKAADLKDGQMLETLQGGKLTVQVKEGKTWLIDETGKSAQVTIADVMDKNGVTHVVDAVLMPNMTKKADKKGKM